MLMILALLIGSLMAACGPGAGEVQEPEDQAVLSAILAEAPSRLPVEDPVRVLPVFVAVYGEGLPKPPRGSADLAMSDAGSLVAAIEAAGAEECELGDAGVCSFERASSARPFLAFSPVVRRDGHAEVGVYVESADPAFALAAKVFRGRTGGAWTIREVREIRSGG